MLLCSVHTERYIREKVLPSSRYEDNSRVEKQEINEMFKSLRDAHSVDDYNERKAKLFSMTEGLLVRPGRVKVPVLFVDYFLKNWEPIKHMWVLAFRKSYPIQVKTCLYLRSDNVIIVVWHFH